MADPPAAAYRCQPPSARQQHEPRQHDQQEPRGARQEDGVGEIGVKTEEVGDQAGEEAAGHQAEEEEHFGVERVQAQGEWWSAFRGLPSGSPQPSRRGARGRVVPRLTASALPTRRVATRSNLHAEIFLARYARKANAPNNNTLS